MKEIKISLVFLLMELLIPLISFCQLFLSKRKRWKKSLEGEIQ
jgi:hypothetical protein